jgi:ATP/maltotriose-dependent transcriptional regulator MalT
MSRIAYRDAEILEWAAPGVYGLDTASYHIARAEIASRAGDEPVARVQWDSARVYLERLNARSSTEVTQGRLAFVYASLGRRDEALRLGRQAASAMARDKYDGTDWVINLARIYMMLGDNDAAVSQLDLVLSIPSRISVEWVRADPIWRPLWNHAGFQKLLSEQRPQATVPIP